MAPHAPNTSDLEAQKSANGATFQHHSRECVRVLGLGMENAQKPGYTHRGAIWRTRDNKLEEENFQEAYLLQFLAKSGAEKAQLGVFGCSKAIGAIYLAF